MTPVREEDDYGGLRVHLKAKFGRMNTPMKINLTCGDAITPREIQYPFQKIFDEGTISVMAYPLETIIAEKYETIVKRGTTTRARDFYNIAILFSRFADEVDWAKLTHAIARTADRRGSSQLLEDYSLVCDELRNSAALHKLWKTYVKENPYAALVDFDDSIDCVRQIGTKIEK